MQSANGTSSTSTATTSRDESGLSPDGTTALSSSEDHEVEPATEYDIGKILESNVSLHDISRDMKYKILTLEVNPDVSCYPRRLYNSGSSRQFQPAWKKQHPWLHYSNHLDGIFCHASAFFAPDKVSGQTPGQFVTKPFRSWVNKTQKMNAHAVMAYHEVAMTKMHEFLTRYKYPDKSIDTLFDSGAKKRMVMNQKVIESLFSIVLLCGRQGLALRGHRDDKCFSNEDVEYHNPGILN